MDHLVSDTLVDAKQRLALRLGRRWRSGDRLPPIRDLARQLQVSHATAQRSVAELARGGFLVTRPRLGTFVSEQYSDEQLRTIFARSAATPTPAPRPVHKQALVIGDSPHMRPAVDALEAALLGRGLEVQSLNSLPNDRAPFVAPPADALVLINPSSACTIQAAPGQAVLIITSAAVHPQVEGATVDRVWVDQEQGGALAAQRLRQLGCDSACFVGVERAPAYGPPYQMTSIRRLRGFESSWGAPLPAAHWLRVDSHSMLFGARAATQYAALNPRPRGIFVACDDLAIGMVHGLAALGMENGRDYHMVSIDGSEALRASGPHAVASVSIPAAYLGRMGAHLLLNRLADAHWPAQEVTLSCDWSNFPA